MFCWYIYLWHTLQMSRTHPTKWNLPRLEIKYLINWMFMIIFDTSHITAGSSFIQTWILITQECFVPKLVKISPVVLEYVFRFCQCIYYLVIIRPWKRRLAFPLNSLEFPSPMNAFCQVLFKKLFCYFVSISL